MLISIVIPTYNSAKFIKSTLSSVLQQTYKNFEIIISDDGSYDNTLAIASCFLIENNFLSYKIIKNNHLGPGAARNKGILQAEGEWISFLDSDDLWANNKLEVVVQFILNNKEVDLICHSEKVIISDGRSINYDYYKQFNFSISPFLSLYRQNSLSTSAVTVRKQILIKSGMFSTHLLSSQDYELWLKISLISGIKISFIEQSLGYYIDREENISSDYKMRYKCLSKISYNYSHLLKNHSSQPILDKINFVYRTNKGYCKSLILDKKYFRSIPYLLKLLVLKVFQKTAYVIHL